MRSYIPYGVSPAVLLPFDNDLAIDEAAFRKHLRDVAATDGISAITINAHSISAWQERQLPDAGIIDTRTRRSPSNGGVASFSPLPFDGGRGWNISTTPLTAPPTQQFPSAAHNTAELRELQCWAAEAALNEKPQPLSHVAGAKFGSL